MTDVARGQREVVDVVLVEVEVVGSIDDEGEEGEIVDEAMVGTDELMGVDVDDTTGEGTAGVRVSDGVAGTELEMTTALLDMASLEDTLLETTLLGAILLGTALLETALMGTAPVKMALLMITLLDEPKALFL